MTRIKNTLVAIRNGLCFSFTWLVLLLMLLTTGSQSESISLSTLYKLLIFCIVVAVLFALLLTDNIIKNKSFMLRLTIFFICFVAAELGLFFSIGFFAGKGSSMQWLIFVGIVVVFYLASLIIDRVIFEKRGVDYTNKLNEYKRKRSFDND